MEVFHYIYFSKIINQNKILLEYLFIIDGEDNIVFGSCNEECPDGFYENKKQNLCQFCDISNYNITIKNINKLFK